MESKLSKFDVFAVALGSIIGWGAFMLPGSKFLLEAGIIDTTIGLTIGAIAMIIIEKSYEYMLANHNGKGGEFSYIYNELGKEHGFISGWFLSLAYLSIIPLNATAFPLVINKISNNILKFGLLYEVAGYDVFFGEVIFSSLIIFIFFILNSRGLKKTIKIQSFITVFLMLFVFIIFIFMCIKSDTHKFFETYIHMRKVNIYGVFKIFAIVPWAFIGFDSIPQLSQNFNFDNKKGARIAVLSIIFSAIIYILLNIITGLVYSPNELNLIEWPTGMAVLSKLGLIFFILLVISLIFAVLGGINGFMISTNKLIEAMAEHKLLPQMFLKLNKNGENGNILVFVTIISLIAPWFGREVLNWIVDMASIGASIAYAYVCYIMLKKSKRLYDKIIGIIGLIFSIGFILLLITPNSPSVLKKESIIMLVAWSIIGIIYYINTYKKNIFSK